MKQTYSACDAALRFQEKYNKEPKPDDFSKNYRQIKENILP